MDISIIIKTACVGTLRPCCKGSLRTTTKPEWVEDKDWPGYLYSEETIAEFKKGLETLRQAFVYIQRIDWLVCGDDDEDTFHPRLKDDLAGGFQFEPPESYEDD